MVAPPVIGITSRKIPFFDRDRPYPRYGVAISYVESVERAGGTPIILPMTQERLVLDGLLGLLDGLLLTGGQDVGPQNYGEEPHALLGSVDPMRDVTELYLARRALAMDMPLLAVCRGEQVLNVACGGSLYQDIHALVGPKCLGHFQNTAEEVPSHSVEVVEGSRLRGITGQDRVMVNSYHHQCVKDLAEGFVISARAADGVVEGIESTRHTFALGVQWHPELLVHQLDFNLALFRSHVEHAGRFRASRLHVQG
jgi:putative glutamine amidotransferase